MTLQNNIQILEENYRMFSWIIPAWLAFLLLQIPLAFFGVTIFLPLFLGFGWLFHKTNKKIQFDNIAESKMTDVWARHQSENQKNIFKFFRWQLYLSILLAVISPLLIYTANELIQQNMLEHLGGPIQDINSLHNNIELSSQLMTASVYYMFFTYCTGLILWLYFIYCVVSGRKDYRKSHEKIVWS